MVRAGFPEDNGVVGELYVAPPSGKGSGVVRQTLANPR